MLVISVSTSLCEPRDVLIARVLAERPQAIEAASHQVLGTGRVHFVAGKLLFDENVVGLVRVEALHYVVAIAPGVRPVHVVLVAVGLGEAHHVQPVAAPLLAIVRGREQPVHHLLPGVGGLIADEAVGISRVFAGL